MKIKGASIAFTLRGVQWTLTPVGLYRNGKRVPDTRIPLRVRYVIGMATCGESTL